MSTQLVEIQPRELKLIFEVKKQSTCTVYLANITDQYVAFKVKTTSPKKYCVRPNVGIIKPNSTCDFTVTMQAQKSVPSEMLCKDKFLIQSTVVPFGTTEDEIIPDMFSRDSGKYMEEIKLRVILTSPANSPVVPRVPGVSKQEGSQEDLIPKEPHSPVLLPVNGVFKQESSYETTVDKDKLPSGVENFPPPDMSTKKVDAIKSIRNMEEPRSLKAMDNVKSDPAKDEEFYLGKVEKVYPDKSVESKRVKDVEEAKLKLQKDIEDLKSKITEMDVKLVEAQDTIVKLTEEKSCTIREKETLIQELASLRRNSGARKVQAGFPPLFVCIVALISVVIGFLFRS